MHHLRSLSTALALAAFSLPATATVLIDNFTDAAVSSAFNGGLFESTGVQAGSMVGGARFTGLLCFFNCFQNAPFGTTLSVGGGALVVTPPAAGLATTRVLWGDVVAGNTTFPLPPLALNLSAENAFELKFNSISDELLVQFVVVSAGGQSVYEPVLNNPGVVLQASGAQTLLLPFSAFVGTAAFGAIEGLAVVLGGNNGAGTEKALATFSLDSVTAVPEPGAGAMWVVGLMGLAAAVARGRKSAVSCGHAPHPQPAAAAPFTAHTAHSGGC